MAAVAKPSPSDARIPCPACGGLIHPVAGRCKHCKHDLAAERTARPAAAVALPSLSRNATPAPAPAPAPPALPYQAATVVAPSPAAIPPGLPPALAPAPPFAIDRASEESKPILPPRPTGGHKAVAPQGWFGRNWPIVVIVLASLAIIGAVVLMMLPPSDPATGKSRSGAPGPAPDRMNTDPLVPRSGPHSHITPTPPPLDIDDPWATPRPPSPPPPPDPYADPDISDPFAQGGIVDPNDPLANNPFRMGGSSTLMFAMLGKMCERAKACPTDPAWDAACSMVAQVPRRPLPANCPSAQRCIDALDKVDLCGTDPSALTSMMLSASECMQAMTSC